MSEGRLRLLYVVLDGAPDGQSPRRSLDVAYTPNLDELSRHSLCYTVYTIAPGVAPESDSAVMSLLGYDPERYYTGRGPLEALGAGLDMREGDVAFRANFATIDPGTRRIIDRRVGRSLSTGEARTLASALDGMSLAGGEAVAYFKATVGHRGVLLLRHKSIRLSAAVTNSDPAYERRGAISVALREYKPILARIEPLNDTPEARVTAELANEFTDKAIEILDSHPVNMERRRRGLLPANAVLLRDAGDRLPSAEPFKERFGINMATIVEMPVERGVARALGLQDFPVDVEGRNRQSLLAEEARLSIKILEEQGFDGVYVHLKGPDEPGHDGDFEGKVKAIEDIDKNFFSIILDKLDLSRTLIIVTSDHATPWALKAHSGDPVPLMLSNPSLETGLESYGETPCIKNAKDTLIGGYRILPLALELARRLGSRHSP